MKSDLAKANMKHIKGVCENDSMSIFGECFVCVQVFQVTVICLQVLHNF